MLHGSPILSEDIAQIGLGFAVWINLNATADATPTPGTVSAGAVAASADLTFNAKGAGHLLLNNGDGANVGVGVAVPLDRLSVNGDISLVGGAARRIYHRAGNVASVIDIDFPELTSVGAQVRLFRLTNTTGSAANALVIYKGDGSASLQTNLSAFGNSYVNALTGNLNVGTATDAGYKLNVNGTGNFAGALSAASAAVTGLITGNKLTITTASGESQGIRLNQTDTSGGLVVNAVTASREANVSFYAQGVQKWSLGKKTNDTFFIYDPSNARNVLETSTSSHLLLMPSGGAVGIGGSPTELLHVVGSRPRVFFGDTGSSRKGLLFDVRNDLTPAYVSIQGYDYGAGNQFPIFIPSRLSLGSGSTAPGRSLHIDGNGLVLIDNNPIAYGEQFLTYSRSYSVNTATPAVLLDSTGAALFATKTYKVTAFVHSTTTLTGAVAYFVGNGTSFTLRKSFEAGTTSNHVEFFLDAGVPSVRVWNHATFYTIRVLTEERNARGSYGVENWIYGSGTSSGRIGINTSTPQAAFHLVDSVVANAHYANSFGSAIIEGGEGLLQLVAGATGTGGASISLTNAPTTGDNTTWNLNHVGTSISGDGLLFRHTVTTASGDVYSGASFTNVLYLHSNGGATFGSAAVAPVGLVDIAHATLPVLNIRSLQNDSLWVAGQEYGTLGFYCSDTTSSLQGQRAKISVIHDGASTTTPTGALAFHAGLAGSMGEKLRITSTGRFGFGTSSVASTVFADFNATDAQSVIYFSNTPNSTVQRAFDLRWNFLGTGGTAYEAASIKGFRSANLDEGRLSFYTKSHAGALTEELRLRADSVVEVFNSFKHKYSGVWHGSTGAFATGANQVAYLNIGDFTALSTYEVTITGPWSTGQAFGKVTRRYTFFKTLGTTSISHVYSETVAAFGWTGERYALGEPEMNGASVRIPVYQIPSNVSNNIIVRVEIISREESYVDAALASLSVTAPTTVANSFTRNHVSLTNSNLGIGTNTPSSKLVIEGSGNPVIALNSTTNAATQLTGLGTGGISIAHGAGGDISFRSGTADATNFVASGNEKMVIKASGFVGINNTNPTNARLEIDSGTGVAAGLRINQTDTSGGAFINAATAARQATTVFADQGTAKWLAGKDTDNTFFIYDSANAVNRLVINQTSGVLSLQPSGGNVCIGGTTSVRPLTVNTTTAQGLSPSIGLAYNSTEQAVWGFTISAGSGFTDAAVNDVIFRSTARLLFGTGYAGTTLAAGMILDGAVLNLGSGGGLKIGGTGSGFLRWNGTIFTSGTINITDLNNITADRLVGSNGSGAITAITLGSNLSLSGGVLSASFTIPQFTGGDVTSSGAGSVVLNIENNAVTTAKILNSAVTLAKIANIGAATILGNNGAMGAAPIALAASDVRTMLSISNVENTALSTWAGSTNLNTIANSTVTLARMANLAANSIIGNNTGSAAVPLALSTSQVRTLLSIGNVENTAISTWPGSTNITTLGTISAGIWQAGVIGETYGGTGQNSYVVGNILFANTTTTLSKLAPNTLSSKRFLSMTGTGSAGNAPSWTAIANGDLPIVDVNHGGTGLGNIQTGQIIYGSGTDTYSSLSVSGHTGLRKVLFLGATIPGWDNIAAADITSGTMATARLGSGTANSGTFLRGDQTWAAIAVDWANITSKPSTFTPSSHSHDITGVEMLSGYVAGRATSGYGSVEELTVGTGLTLTSGGVLRLDAVNDLTIMGNNSGGSAAPVPLTAAQTKTLLGITSGDITGVTGSRILGRYSGTSGACQEIVCGASVQLNAGANSLELQNDDGDPGFDKYYGTDGSGAKGWHDLPSGGGGLTGWDSSGTDNHLLPTANLTREIGSSTAKVKKLWVDDINVDGDIVAGGSVVAQSVGVNGTVSASSGIIITQSAGSGSTTFPTAAGSGHIHVVTNGAGGHNYLGVYVAGGWYKIQLA